MFMLPFYAINVDVKVKITQKKQQQQKTGFISPMYS
jgi:hypothetical protein